MGEDALALYTWCDIRGCEGRVRYRVVTIYNEVFELCERHGAVDEVYTVDITWKGKG